MNRYFICLLAPACLYFQGFPLYSQQRTDSATAYSAATAEKIVYEDHFTAERLRVDYLMAGDAKETSVYLVQVKKELTWGGPRGNIIDPFNYGTYRITLMDSATGTLIYSRGFCNLFQEWQGTPEAKTTKKAFSQVAVTPFPKSTVLFTVDKRRYEDGQFERIFSLYINPVDYFINAERPIPLPYEKFRNSGDPADKVDIVFLAEGYPLEEMPKFREDARRISDYLLSVKPFSHFKDEFNFYTVESPSMERGIDIPGNRVYINTDFNSSFYTFDMDRYLTTSDVRAVYDIAAQVPYDAIIILVNSNRYGGGGFYNTYAESTVDHPYSAIVTVHEFGHSFAGLADEYYSSEVTYSDFYNLRVEPWEPNITTNVNFGAKWKHKIPYGTPIPTPRSEAYFETVGMFEGGGYLGKGIYSPMENCRMKSNDAKGFCPVCEDAIKKKIRWYCD